MVLGFIQIQFSDNTGTRPQPPLGNIRERIADATPTARILSEDALFKEVLNVTERGIV